MCCKHCFSLLDSFDTQIAVYSFHLEFTAKEFFFILPKVFIFCMGLSHLKEVCKICDCQKF